MEGRTIEREDDRLNIDMNGAGDVQWRIYGGAQKFSEVM